MQNLVTPADTIDQILRLTDFSTSKLPIRSILILEIMGKSRFEILTFEEGVLASGRHLYKGVLEPKET